MVTSITANSVPLSLCCVVIIYLWANSGFPCAAGKPFQTSSHLVSSVWFTAALVDACHHQPCATPDHSPPVRSLWCSQQTVLNCFSLLVFAFFLLSIIVQLNINHLFVMTFGAKSVLINVVTGWPIYTITSEVLQLKGSMQKWCRTSFNCWI